MVARGAHLGDDARHGRVIRLFAAVFLTWRRWVTLAVRGGASLAHACTNGGRRLARGAGRATGRAGIGLRRTIAASFHAWRRSLARAAARVRSLPEAARSAGLGLAATASVAAGAVLSLTLAPRLGVPQAEAAIALAWTLGWTGLRLGVLRVTMPDAPPTLVRRAWAYGLLPAFASLTDLFRLGVLAVSAWLTLRTLVRGGTAVQDARRGVAWAYGAEVAATIVRWLAAAALLWIVAR